MIKPNHFIMLISRVEIKDVPIKYPLPNN